MAATQNDTETQVPDSPMPTEPDKYLPQADRDSEGKMMLGLLLGAFATFIIFAFALVLSG